MPALWQIQAANEAALADAGVRYCWVVTHEYNERAWPQSGGSWTKLDQPVYGPRDATEEDMRRAEHGRSFRLDYDGEDGPCAKGKIWTSDSTNPAHSEACWAPLDDYGRGNYGATEILYRNANNAWEAL